MSAQRWLRHLALAALPLVMIGCGTAPPTTTPSKVVGPPVEKKDAGKESPKPPSPDPG